MYLAVSPLRDLDDAIERTAHRVTRSPGASIGAYLASNDGLFGLAWSDNSGGSYDVFFQRFDAKGNSVTSPQRLANSDAQSLVPAIRRWGKGFIVAWNEVLPSEAGYHDNKTRSEIVIRTTR